MATMEEIARVAGVSLGTVSNVLNNLPTVKERLRRRVLDAVDAVGYQPSQIARALAKDKTNIIGMVIPDVTNPIFPTIVKGAEDTAYRHGYRLFLCNSDNNFAKEEAYLRDLQTYRPSGVIIITSDLKGETTLMDASLKNGTAVVYVDRVPKHWRGDTVGYTNERGAYEAVKYLVKLGHRSIAMVAGSRSQTNSAERIKGYRKALTEADIAIVPEYLQEDNFEEDGGRLRTKSLLEMRPRPTAIFAANDLIAFGAIAAIEEAGLRCPDDVSVVGFDDLLFSKFVNPSLTSVDLAGYQLGAIAAQTIIDRLSGDKGPAKKIRLQTTLRPRNSTAPPRHVAGMGRNPASQAKSTAAKRTRATAKK